VGARRRRALCRCAPLDSGWLRVAHGGSRAKTPPLAARPVPWNGQGWISGSANGQVILQHTCVDPGRSRLRCSGLNNHICRQCHQSDLVCRTKDCSYHPCATPNTVCRHLHTWEVHLPTGIRRTRTEMNTFPSKLPLLEVKMLPLSSPMAASQSPGGKSRVEVI